MTLRLRLILVLVGVVAAGLLLADAATYASLRTYLFDQVNTQLQQDVAPIATQLEDPLGHGRFGFGQAVAFGPTGLWIAVRDQSGSTHYETLGYPLPAPELPLALPGSGSASANTTLFDASSGGAQNITYRVLAEPFPVDGGGGTLVLAIPLDDLHHTLGELLLIEGLVSAAVLVGLGTLAWWMVRRNLRPLDEMTATAGAIAGGDLSRRVEVTDEFTEVGQLGRALNTMLTGIEEAFAARAASEQRLRLFLADASHELRTPLTSIRGYAELFDRGARDRPEDLATSMRHIREEANRMSALVDELLLLARLDRQRPLALEHLDLCDIVTEAVDAARVSSPERTILLAASGPVPVQGDPLRLRQVADNLLANAVQHTPPDSSVEVRVGIRSGAARLEVEDTGPGVPPDEQAKIFEPFHRADPTRARATGGAGLGLTIVSAIAHAHGGDAGVVSPSPRGASTRRSEQPGGADRTPGPATDGTATDGAVGHAEGTEAGSGAPGAVFWVRLPLAPAPADGDGARQPEPSKATAGASSS